MEKNIIDVVIIGAGPAGLTAAIYAKRSGLSVAILEEGMPGGKLAETFEISNWPGTEKAQGADLALEMLNHATSLEADYKFGDVKNVRKVDDIFEIETSTEIHYAKTVIVATGTKERKLGIPNEDKYFGKGISYCAVCDGSFYVDEDVAVIGGGNSALEESIYLAGLVNKVTIVVRRDVLRAESHVIDAVKKTPNIEFKYLHSPTEIIGDGDVVTGVRIKSNVDDSEEVLDVKAVFPYIGADPLSYMVKDLVELNEHGYIITDRDMRTNIPGLFAAGDITVKNMRQVVTAAGDGAIAAQSAHQYINSI